MRGLEQYSSKNFKVEEPPHENPEENCDDGDQKLKNHSVRCQLGPCVCYSFGPAENGTFKDKE